ncbi:hypothetical protein JOM56_002580 [Amanita muscaria]
MVNHIYSILHFNCAEVVAKVRSISDAQRLIDLLVHLVDEKCMLSQYKPDATSKAAQLVLRIFDMIPVLPRSLNMKDIYSYDKAGIDGGVYFKFQKDRCRFVLMWRVLDKNYIHLDMELQEDSLIPDNVSLWYNAWLQILPLDSNTVIELVLDVATAIQYFHSMGFMPSPSFTFGDVYLDLSLRPRIRFDAVTVITGFDEEESIFAFGRFFYASVRPRQQSQSMRGSSSSAVVPKIQGAGRPLSKL